MKKKKPLKIFHWGDDCIKEVSLSVFKRNVIGVSVEPRDYDSYPKNEEKIQDFIDWRYEGKNGVYFIAESKSRVFKIEESHDRDMALMWKEMDRSND